LQEVLHQGHAPLGSCYNSVFFRKPCPLDLSASKSSFWGPARGWRTHVVARVNAVVWEQQLYFMSRLLLGKEQEKGRVLWNWAFQGSPVSGHGQKAVLHLTWPQTEGLSSPNAKQDGEHRFEIGIW